MKIRTIRYFIAEGTKSVITNRVMSLASITTVTAALFILGIFMLMAVNVNRIVNTVEQRIEIKAFLKDDITTSDKDESEAKDESEIREEIKDRISEIQGVTEVTYESKEEALENFREQLGENEDLAKGLEMKNPLPASFIVKVESPEDVKYVSSEISKL
jgi:cell division transport system permease protein